MFAFSADGKWEPGIGDPTVMGWVTVAAYFLASALCWRTGRIASKKSGWLAGPALFWHIFTVGLAGLGVNKQLDLQTWLTLFFKNIAVNAGWYQDRRQFQAAFIGMITLTSAAGLVGMRLLAGGMRRPALVALSGGIFLSAFILIRAVSFHHVDRMLGMDFEGLRLNWLFELGGIACVAWGAWLGSKEGAPNAR